MITLNVFYNAKPGQGRAFLDALYAEDIPANCIAEDGCFQYDYFIAKDNPDLILLVEQWKDEAAQEFHCGTPHMKRLRELKAIYVESTDIKTYR